MSNLYPRRVRSTSARRRQLFAVITAALLILQSALFASSPALAQKGVKLIAPAPAPLTGVKPKISITTLPTTITQNFDTLPASGSATFTNDSTLPGWYYARTGTGTTIVANDGSSNAGNLYSYGTGTATDRALGSLGSGGATAGSFFWGLLLTNNTGSTIGSLDVAYTGEQWRNSAAAAQTVAFSYITGTTITGSLADFQAAGTNVTALDFTSPVTGGTAGALNGNLAANRTARSTTISGVNLAAGQSILLRWSDPDHTGLDHGLSIDDFSVTAGASAGSPTLSINDVTQAEGNAGQTAFNFTVSLTSPAPAGGVSFTVNTADGTTNPATAGSDYVAITNGSGSIAQGATSTTVTVQVNGDTTTEPNETFFVNLTNVTGATAGDVQGLGTISNDDVTTIAIHDIQGSGTTSPLVGTSVTTTGIVTGLKSNGFFLQTPDANADADPNTSEGIFVFTSTAPPAAAAIGNSVNVSATVQEFIPPGTNGDPYSPPTTELITPTVVLLSTGNPLPAPHTLTAAETTAPSGTTNPLDSLEEFEGMRVTVPSLTVVAPTQGTINEPNATVTSNGVFYGVVTGVARPFREPGIAISNPLPAGAPATVPRFDENPERIRVDSDAQPGTTALNLTAGTVLTNVTGPLDFGFRTYTIDPDLATPPTVGALQTAQPVPARTANELTVASFNMERFFDTIDDPGTSDPVLTTTAFNNRLAKASLIIRTIQRSPDVIGVEEMENLTTLQAVADKINADAGTPNDYQAYLVEGNDIGGIDNGFLVRSSRVTVVDVTQVGKTDTFTNPDNSTSILNDRPPLVLRATAPRPTGGTFAFTVIVNHLRSLSGIDSTAAGTNGFATEGDRIRFKRRAQAEFLANYIQGRQSADPTEKILSVGDYNAFQINDGYVDSIGTIKGTPAPASQVTLASSDLVNPDLTDLVDTLPADQRYSFSFDGNAQVLDHIIVNQPVLPIISRFVYARDDSDFPVKDYEDPAKPQRLSDHDQPIVYLSLGVAQPAGSVIISEFRFSGPCSPVPVAAPCNLATQSGGGDSFGSPAPPVSSDGGASNAPGTPEDNDEFIEIYNNTNSDITVATTDGSPGWALVASDGATRFIIPNGTVIRARRHFLGVNTDGYSLGGYATPDNVLLPDGVTTAGGYTQNIPNGSGIALFRTSNPANFTTAERLDAVGCTTVPALYREGNGLPTGGAETTSALEYSWHRQQCAFVAGVGCTTPGTPKDTGNNATDFKSVDTQGMTQSLGAPGPESSTSPFQRNAQFPVALLDSGVSQSAAPNRVRDPMSDPANNSQFGTLSIRRKVTNNTGGPITYLAFRIIQITTFPAESSATADLRARNSGDIQVTVNGTPVDVRGTQLEQPPNQPQGGGLNTSMAVGFLNLGNSVANGDSINLQFLLGVQKTGTFRFYINVEAFDESAVVSPLPHTLNMQKGRR